MFKGIQSFIKNKMHDGPRGQSKLSPVLTPDKIIAEKRRADLIAKLPMQLSLPEEKYNPLALTLVRRFAEYAQLLPETRNSYFSHNGGLFDHGLERASAALSLVRAYFLPESSESTSLSQPQTLWMYAVFSAALLNGVGKLATDFIIEIFDSQEKFIRTWCPFAGSLLTQGAFYDYEFDNVHPDSFKRRATILLARQLMPEEGFLWIASDKDVFAMWLALLEDDQRDAGTLGPILWRAEAQVINNYFNQPKFTKDYSVKERSTFSPSGMPFNMPTTVGERQVRAGENTQAGIEFIRWLHSGLLSQKFNVNQSRLFVVPGGMLMHQDMMKYFIREHPEYKNWVAVQNALIDLELHTLGSDGEVVQKFDRSSDGTQHSGVVLSTKNLGMILPDQFHVMKAGQTDPTLYSAHQLMQDASLQQAFAHSARAATTLAKNVIGSDGKWTSDPRLSQQEPRHSPTNPFR